MPLFEQEATPRGRLRVFVRAQLPLLLATVFVFVVAVVAVPSALTSSVFLLGVGSIVAASIAAAAVPWETVSPSSLISVAVVDIAGVAFIRAELLDDIPSIGMLAIFPILWLSYGFGRPAILLAVGGALFITSYEFAYNGTWPSTALQWANVITLPALIIAVAIVVNVASSQLRRNRQRLLVALDSQAKALRDSHDNELLSRAILDTVTAGVAFYDADNRLVVANDSASALVGLVGFRLDEPPYAGVNVLAADRTTTIPFDQQIIPRALRGEAIDEHVEWLGPAGAQVAIMASARRVHRPDGDLLGTVIVAYDITELAQAIDIREEFLTTVSHELRTPLTSMTGYLELLEDSLAVTDTTSARYLEVISRNTKTLRDRIADLLAATESETVVDPRSIHLGAIVDDAVSAVSELATARGHLVDVRRTHAATAWVQGDPGQLRQAFTELLTNAIKFSPPESRITVELDTTDAEVIVSVHDRGPGLDRGERAQMFDRFYRTPFARSSAIQGFGLGLAMVKNTIDGHRGRVSVASAEGRGSRVTVAIPRDKTV
ncbi:signal transduction histidine kinase [Labedella gwakjiensis]|uniref:Sensor-like histidine kinase SenX3 n=1 Tax=Labedella gwakjiensis TaxID=390269 RepID=A0A2P8GW33_9MICO|nr:ATP-binding protein [Labedella gwakjiensis]PSL38174.1 signal transduction histidine kinase [Labedella gwakjiensis]RUQ87279.1 PAS domain-containing sensor histidine kinase [Labedella gwakjiensis]